MTDAVMSGSPDPSKQIFTLKNFLMVIGLIMAGSWMLLMWNVKTAADDIHMAVTNAAEAKTLATTNKDAIDRMTRTEARLANIATDHDTRLSIAEDHLHIPRSPSIRLYGGDNR